MATAKRRHETLDGDLGEQSSDADDDDECEESPGKRVKLEQHQDLFTAADQSQFSV